VPYAQWKLPAGKYRARDHAHFNAQGYAIVIARMLPEIETLIARVKTR
jgi:lysophospholipase L1-like esterase